MDETAWHKEAQLLGCEDPTMDGAYHEWISRPWLTMIASPDVNYNWLAANKPRLMATPVSEQNFTSTPAHVAWFFNRQLVGGVPTYSTSKR